MIVDRNISYKHTFGLVCKPPSVFVYNELSLSNNQYSWFEFKIINLPTTTFVMGA
jgi:hypothetical protein